MVATGLVSVAVNVQNIAVLGATHIITTFIGGAFWGLILCAAIWAFAEFGDKERPVTVGVVTSVASYTLLLALFGKVGAMLSSPIDLLLVAATIIGFGVAAGLGFKFSAERFK